VASYRPAGTSAPPPPQAVSERQPRKNPRGTQQKDRDNSGVVSAMQWRIGALQQPANLAR